MTVGEGRNFLNEGAHTLRLTVEDHEELGQQN